MASTLGLRPRDFALFGFVVSHPFARKKAKGWGTVLVQNQKVKDLVAIANWIQFRNQLHFSKVPGLLIALFKGEMSRILAPDPTTFIRPTSKMGVEAGFQVLSRTYIDASLLIEYPVHAGRSRRIGGDAPFRKYNTGIRTEWHSLPSGLSCLRIGLRLMHSGRIFKSLNLIHSSHLLCGCAERVRSPT